jgi:hypothetical protein
VTELSPGERRRAGEEADTWEEVLYVSAFGGGLVTAFPAAIVAGGLLAAPLGPLLFFGGLGYMGLRKRHAAKRKQNDPARDDYFETTVPELRPLRLEPFGFDPLGQATAHLLEAVDRAAAYELAMVIANERALGARQAGLESTASARLDEALALGSRATALNLDVEHLADALAGALNELQPLRLTADQIAVVHDSLDRTFDAPPPEQVELLRRVGVDPTEERHETEPVDFSLSLRQGVNLYGATAIALRKAGQQTGAFAMAYRQAHGESGPAIA